MPTQFERQIRTSYVVLLILATLAVYSLIANMLLRVPTPTLLSVVALVSFGVTALLHRRRWHMLGRVQMLLTADLLLFVDSYFEHPSSNISLVLLTFVGLPFIVFSWRENRLLVGALSAMPLVLWNILIFTNYGDLKYVEIDEETSRAFGYWHSTVVFFLVAAEFAYFDYVTHRYSKALRKSLAAEEKAGRAKTAFLSSMNHEIRTPLNAIIGSADLLRTHPEATPDIRRLADYIDRAGQNILTMSEKSLTYTKLISSPIDVSLSAEDPMELIQAELARFETLIRSKDLKVETRQICADPVLADPKLLSKVLAQLIDNAAKYLPQHGTVKFIVAQGVDGTIRISIKDNGPGIPIEMREQVFQPFERLQQTLGTQSGGGVGLTIAKTYVEAMGGDIGIAPISSGGTHVWVELPRVVTKKNKKRIAKDTLIGPVAVLAEPVQPN